MKNCKGIKLNGILEKYGTVSYARYKIRVKKKKNGRFGMGRL